MYSSGQTLRKQGTQSQGSKGIAYDSRLPYLMRMDLLSNIMSGRVYLLEI